LVILQHKALAGFSWKNLREHNFVSIIFMFFEKKDLATFLFHYYRNNETK